MRNRLVNQTTTFLILPQTAPTLDTHRQPHATLYLRTLVHRAQPTNMTHSKMTTQTTRQIEPSRLPHALGLSMQAGAELRKSPNRGHKGRWGRRGRRGRYGAGLNSPNCPQPQSWTDSPLALAGAEGAGGAGFSKTFPKSPKQCGKCRSSAGMISKSALLPKARHFLDQL